MTKRSVTVEKSFDNKEVSKIMVLSSSLAHELKNYLAAINICTELAEGKLGAIKKKIKAADYLINNLQLQIKGIIAGKVNPKDFRICAISKNIEEVLEQYPFETKEHELISVKISKDFKYNGNPILTNHIFYNLIKNSLRAIKNAGKGSITIKSRDGISFNELIFKDTALGISKKFLPKVFTLFESQMSSKGGTGIGLAFCKLIMRSFGGNITCSSIEGKYTEFTLKFPKL